MSDRQENRIDVLMRTIESLLDELENRKLEIREYREELSETKAENRRYSARVIELERKLKNLEGSAS